MLKLNKISYFTIGFIISLISSNGSAQGLIGGAIEGIGRATGIQPLEDLGRNADAEHRRIKDHNPDYRAVEEQGSEIVRRQFTAACTVPYQTITNAVIAHCSNWDGRLDDQHLIENAKEILIANRVFHPNDFNGIQIRWCPLTGAHGMAPDRGRIYLDTPGKQDSPEDLAVLLAHEMAHIIQYRRMGSDNFKCEYSRNYVDCGFCQNESHALEREAYQFQENVSNRLAENDPTPYTGQNTIQQSFQQQMPPTGVPVRYCQTHMGTCQIPPAMVPMGSACYCNTGVGQIPGSAF